MSDDETIVIFQPKEIGDFWIKATHGDYSCDFVCIQCVALGDSGGKYDIPWYPRAGATAGHDQVEKPELAQVYLSGHIKWDGCANLRFDEQDRVMLHFCGRRDAEKVGKLLGRLYDNAADLITRWDKSLAENK